MKKIVSLLLAVIMCVALFTGCAGKADPTEAPTQVPTDAPPESTPEAPPAETAPASDSDLVESDMLDIFGSRKLVVGITLYEPMNYYNEDGDLTGFDTEFAELVAAEMNLTPEFVEINWDTKEIELASKTIDCIWNGMTITPARAEEMSISLPYVKNAQVVVVKKDSGITSTADLEGKTVVAELGSAGEAQIEGDDAEENLAKADYIGMGKQTDCLMEVKSGTADACVLDWTLASAMVGEGTDYADLEMLDIELGAEEYGIAFRKGSDMTEAVNAVILNLVKDGRLVALAEKYGLSLSPEITE